RWRAGQRMYPVGVEGSCSRSVRAAGEAAALPTMPPRWAGLLLTRGSGGHCFAARLNGRPWLGVRQARAVVLLQLLPEVVHLLIDADEPQFLVGMIGGSFDAREERFEIA